MSRQLLLRAIALTIVLVAVALFAAGSQRPPGTVVAQDVEILAPLRRLYDYRVSVSVEAHYTETVWSGRPITVTQRERLQVAYDRRGDTRYKLYERDVRSTGLPSGEQSRVEQYIVAGTHYRMESGEYGVTRCVLSEPRTVPDLADLLRGLTRIPKAWLVVPDEEVGWWGPGPVKLDHYRFILAPDPATGLVSAEGDIWGPLEQYGIARYTGTARYEGERAGAAAGGFGPGRRVVRFYYGQDPVDYFPVVRLPEGCPQAPASPQLIGGHPLPSSAASSLNRPAARSRSGGLRAWKGRSSTSGSSAEPVNWTNLPEGRWSKMT
jgi:hypothetical protein